MANKGRCERKFGAILSSLDEVAEYCSDGKTILEEVESDARDGEVNVDAMVLEATKAKGLFEAFRSPTVADPARRQRRRKECGGIFFLARKTL